MHPVPVAQHPLRAWLHATLPQVLLAHVLSLAGGECGHSQVLARAAPALAVGVERRPGQLVKLVFVHCLLCCLGVTSRQSLVVAQRPRLLRLPVRPVISNTQGLRYKACGAIPRSTGDAPGRAGLWAQSASRHSRASARAARGLSGARPYRGSADAPEGGLQACTAVACDRSLVQGPYCGHEHIQKKYASLDRPPVKIHLTQPLLPWLQPRSSRVEHVRGVRSSACDMWRAAIWAMHLHCVWLDSLASGFVPMRSVALGGHPVGRSLSVAVIRGSGPKDSGVICVSVSLALCAMSMMTTALSN